MKSTIVGVIVIVTASVIATGCGGPNEQPNRDMSSTPAQPPATSPATGTGSAQKIEITFNSVPDPPRTGENTFDVMVMSAGQPVTDVDVAVEFFMAAMPSMNMPEMRNTVALKHEGGGRYRGSGNVMMAGSWDATVTVKRGGQQIGSQKFPVTAK